ncbi:DUF447 domain-containing protein [Haladaptatus sp. DYSN1]|uniref:DUF447 domain-containing protein n=1 Tax=unclassified Haladaptatus TaxID=2622732 RepID=UPI00240604AB|nr:DUF447 domain-containing protein [Haladaptatus sp. DYSN1]
MEPGWPVELRGVTESLVTTRGPNGKWNVAALGLHAGGPVTARTFGRTRTWRNFHARGEGYVQFPTDPVDFVAGALSVYEVADPILDSASAWARVKTKRVSEEARGGITVETWELTPVESAEVAAAVPTINRGFNAVIEATVAASRLDVLEYDTETLAARLSYLADVVETCGGPREREALKRLRSLVSWE